MNKDCFNGPAHDPGRSVNVIRIVVAFILITHPIFRSGRRLDIARMQQRKATPARTPPLAKRLSRFRLGLSLKVSQWTRANRLYKSSSG
jgi:hypothetical protein